MHTGLVQLVCPVSITAMRKPSPSRRWESAHTAATSRLHAQEMQRCPEIATVIHTKNKCLQRCDMTHEDWIDWIVAAFNAQRL